MVKPPLEDDEEPDNKTLEGQEIKTLTTNKLLNRLSINHFHAVRRITFNIIF